MSRRQIPQELRVSILRYNRNAKQYRLQAKEHFALGSKISKGLQRQVARATAECEPLRKKVFWMKDMETDCFLDIVKAFEPMFHAPLEPINVRSRMIYIRKGKCSVRMHFLGRGDVYGHNDILLASAVLIDRVSPRSLTYVDLLQLMRDRLQTICSEYPYTDRRLRRAQIRIATWRGFVQEAQSRKRKLDAEANKVSSPAPAPPESFAMPELPAGRPEHAAICQGRGDVMLWERQGNLERQVDALATKTENVLDLVKQIGSHVGLLTHSGAARCQHGTFSHT